MVKKHDRVTRSCSILAQIGYEVACMQHLSRSASSSCNVSDWLRGRTHASFIRQRQQQQLQRLGLVTRSHARSIYRVAPAAAVAASGSISCSALYLATVAASCTSAAVTTSVNVSSLRYATRSHARSIYRVASAAAVARLAVWQHQLQRRVLKQQLQRLVMKQQL